MIIPSELKDRQMLLDFVNSTGLSYLDIIALCVRVMKSQNYKASV